ncbi:uncharacterized protein LOC131958425 [Physella acuta]|uniref:uncharacterized protein LOC131958425 n=1 Tax=Physella acuta TaxID=109671 RepID=UPI0027DDA420|nr:uncharacterized protein LOC131958425 [Physella acuta]
MAEVIGPKMTIQSNSALFQKALNSWMLLGFLLLGYLLDETETCLSLRGAQFFSPTCMFEGEGYEEGDVMQKFAKVNGQQICLMYTCFRGAALSVQGPECKDYKGVCQEEKTLYKHYKGSQRLECFCLVELNTETNSFVNNIVCYPYNY